MTIPSQVFALVLIPIDVNYRIDMKYKIYLSIFQYERTSQEHERWPDLIFNPSISYWVNNFSWKLNERLKKIANWTVDNNKSLKITWNSLHGFWWIKKNVILHHLNERENRLVSDNDFTNDDFNKTHGHYKMINHWPKWTLIQYLV